MNLTSFLYYTLDQKITSLFSVVGPQLESALRSKKLYVFLPWPHERSHGREYPSKYLLLPARYIQPLVLPIITNLSQSDTNSLYFCGRETTEVFDMKANAREGT